MSFEITGPGKYKTRTGRIANITRTGNGYAIGDIDGFPREWVAKNGRWAVSRETDNDIVARVDEPQPDVQDGIRGVEPAKPTQSALERLEAWRGSTDRKLWRIDIEEVLGDCSIHVRRFEREPQHVNDWPKNVLDIKASGPTIEAAINAALDLAEGAK